MVAFASLTGGLGWAQAQDTLAAPDPQTAPTLPAAPSAIAPDSATSGTIPGTEPGIARPRAGFVSLDGGGIAPLAGRRSHLLFGGNALGGYDSAFAGVPDTAGSVSGGSLFGAAIFTSPRYSLVLQNNANLLNSSASGGAFEYFDSASATFSSNVSRTLTWTAMVENAFGSNAVRSIAPVDTAQVGNLSAPSPETPLFALQLGTVFSNNAAFAAEGPTGRYGGWRLALRNSYRSVSSEQQADNTVRLRAEYMLKESPHISWGVFEETAHQSGTQRCSTQAGGATVQYQMLERTTVQLSGGPAVGTAGCVVRLTGSFSGSATTAMGRSLALYAAADRQLNQSVLVRTTWQTTVQGGVIDRLSPSWAARADTGYLHGTQPESSGSFDSSYEGGSLEHTIRGGLVATMTARRFNYSGMGATIPSRSQVFFTLGWTGKRRTASPSAVSPVLNGAASR